MGSSLSPLQHSYQHPMGYLDLLQFKLGLINYGSYYAYSGSGSDFSPILTPAPAPTFLPEPAGSCFGSETLPTT